MSQQASRDALGRREKLSLTVGNELHRPCTRQGANRETVVERSKLSPRKFLELIYDPYLE